MSAYVWTIYLFLWVVTLLGSFNHRFDANLLQRLGLCFFGCGALYGIKLNFDRGGAELQDMIVVTGLAIYALGTVFKTNSFKSKTKAGD